MTPGAAIRRGLGAVLSFATMVLVMPASLRPQEDTPKPTVSDTALTPEQLAVYHTLLTDWFQSEKFRINLSELTSSSTSPDGSDDSECGKSLSLEKAPNEVHRFGQSDLAQLGIEGKIHLVDPDAHARQVREHDPGRAIRNGGSVDEAVKDGFAHGLFTLGEIRFDKSHTHAVVSFSFWCGSLCGHGSTILFEKREGIWKQKKQCGGWIS